jgi:hypothetical protein
MLYEELSLQVPDSTPVMQNTDGLEMIIPIEHEALFKKICSEWEVKTSLELEYADYDRMIIADVNNYIAVYKNGTTKCKGRFEYEDRAFHKNKSASIVPKALYAYFIHGVKPEDFIADNQNIYDYCIGVKAKGDFYFTEHKIVNGFYEQNRLQKMIRYFVSNAGSCLIKSHTDGRNFQVNSGNVKQQLFNTYVEKPWHEHNVNQKYYLKRINDEILNIETGFVDKQQLTFISGF